MATQAKSAKKDGGKKERRRLERYYGIEWVFREKEEEEKIGRRRRSVGRRG